MSLTVGVVIPTHNAERFVEEALDSVIGQTRPPDKVVVVDDGSTDRTREVIAAWMARTRSPIEVVCQENSGAAAARNRGVAELDCELIAMLDADDVWLPGCLETLVQPFERYGDLLVSFADLELLGGDQASGLTFLSDKHLFELPYKEDSDGFRLIRTSIYGSLVRGNYVLPSATVISNKAFRDVGGFDPEQFLGHDRELFMRMSRIGPFGYYSKVVCRRRIHGAALTSPARATERSRLALRTLQKALNNSDDMNLSPDEIAVTRRAADDATRTLFYWSSRAGLGELWRAWSCARNTLNVDCRPRPKDVLRAFFYSMRRSS